MTTRDEHESGSSRGKTRRGKGKADRASRKSGTRRASSRAELTHDGTRWLLRARYDADVGTEPPAGAVPALVNCIAIISYLNNTCPKPATLAELSANLGISKSHCFSLLKTLVYFDWLHFDDTTKAYRLRSGILRDTSSLLHHSSMMIDIRRALGQLAERARMPCVLSQPLADDTFVVVDKFNIPDVMEVSFPIGHRFSRNACAQMRAYLAWQSQERIERWFEGWQPVCYTERTLVDADQIRTEIKATRERGYARSIGEFTEGLMVIALPIFNRDGEVAFVFNCSSFIPVIEKCELAVAREMVRTMTEIHRSLGARTPPDLPSEL